MPWAKRKERKKIDLDSSFSSFLKSINFKFYQTYFFKYLFVLHRLQFLKDEIKTSNFPMLI